MFVIDTDILSIFAKSDNIGLLYELFGDSAVMTPAIFQEITAPIDYGYEFPYAIIQTIRTVQMNDDALLCYKQISKNKKLGRGECEAIAFCLKTSSIFITNDKKARDIASGYGITVISLPAILKAIIIKRIRTPEEVKEILDKMKKSDNYSIISEVERGIFQ